MKKTVCVIFGREGYETEVLWKSAAGHLKDALKRTGLERIFDAPGLFGGDAAPVAVPEDAGMVLAVRSDAVPSDAAALLSAEAPRRFMDEDGLAAFLLDARRFAALAESGGSAEAVMRVPEGRASFERGFAANASARERFELTGRLNREKLSALLVGGVRLLSADGVLVCPDAELGEGCEILPGTVIKGGVKVGKDCLLGPNTTSSLVTTLLECHTSSLPEVRSRVRRNLIGRIQAIEMRDVTVFITWIIQILTPLLKLTILTHLHRRNHRDSPLKLLLEISIHIQNLSRS